MKLEQLNSDVRTLEHRAWSPWLEVAARLTGRFNDELSGDDPFSYNEAASVSLLTAAAALLRQSGPGRVHHYQKGGP